MGIQHKIKAFCVAAIVCCLILACSTPPAVNPPPWWNDFTPETAALVYEKGTSGKCPKEDAAWRKAYNDGFAKLLKRITPDTNLWPWIPLAESDIPTESIQTDSKGNCYAWVLLSYPRARLETALQRAKAFAKKAEEGVATRGVDSRDYQLVVEKMVGSILKNGLQTEDGRKPVIALGEISNHSTCNVETRLLGELILGGVLKAGLAKGPTATGFECKRDESGDLYKQLKHQNASGCVDPITVKHYGQIIGADYILFGNIYDFERRANGLTEANFTFNLALIDAKTGLLVWEDTKTIRKRLKTSR